MSRTSDLRVQHDDALALVQQVRAYAEAPGTPGADDAFELGLVLAKLAGDLRTHFAQENQVLYPQMMASGNLETVDTARRFHNEMGAISSAFTTFVERWRDVVAIRRNWSGFRLEAKQVCDTLEQRIERENAVLYALADEMKEPRQTAKAA